METKNQSLLETYFQLVEGAYNQNASTFRIHKVSLAEKNEILVNARSILMVRDGIIPASPGSFIESFVNGNLFGVLNTADTLCMKSLHFFAYIFWQKFLD